MSIDFPTELKLSRIAYCANILLHLRGRTDMNMGPVGTKLQPILSAAQQLRPEFIDQFYDMLQSTFKVIDKYGALAESCMTSRQYQNQREDQFQILLNVLAELEKQTAVINGLRGMLRSDAQVIS